MKTRTTLRAAVAAVLATGLLTGAAATATADQAAPQGQLKRLTVKDYTSYLKQSKAPEAKRVYKGFKKLSAKDQQRFVNYLQNRNVYKAFVSSTKGHPMEGGAHFTKKYNRDVKFTTDVKPTSKGTTNKTHLVTHTVTEKIYNIPVTTQVFKLKYRTKYKKLIPGSVTARTAVSNANKVIHIRPGKVGARPVGNKATGSTIWHAVPGYKSFGKEVAKNHKLTATWDVRWTAKLTNR
ncbi:hypothetical protein [Streptomyces sp. NPDC002851]